MKISVLTPTYNREKLIKRLYESLLKNSKYNVEIEWLIMDDGSTDNTKNEIENYISQGKINIKYFTQKNQGKMTALNNIVNYATGNLIIECDSDDYFTDNAFELIKKEYEKLENGEYEGEKIYAICFLKNNQDGNNMGKNFKHTLTTMFDLYFKEEEDGEKALVFLANVRKKYKYELEAGERFVTEARMYHKMDLDYKMLCINEPIMICEYQKDGYSNNIMKQFKENPKGYYKYFKEILQRGLKGVTFKKKMYVIKHFVWFWYLVKKSHN